jgi:hypothetical protein
MYDRARRLLMLATKPDNPSAQMEIAACDVGVHKIQHRLNIFGFAEDFVPRFRYQQMITLAGELAQQALEAGRQLIGFWQQAEQAQRAELETSQVVALNGAMVEAEELRVEEAKAMSAIADLQVQQTARQITDLNARIGELSDPVFFWAAFATGVQSGLGFFATGAALGGPIGTLVGVVSGGGAGSAGGPAAVLPPEPPAGEPSAASPAAFWELLPVDIWPTPRAQLNGRRMNQTSTTRNVARPCSRILALPSRRPSSNRRRLRS